MDEPERAANLFLTRPAGSIAYTDQGNGPLVVMVPGLGDVKEVYRFLAPKVAVAGFRTVTMDLRGLGASSVNWKAYTNAAIGQDILALVEHLAAGPATVVGNSMGGGAATWAAAEAPTTINGLVLIGAFVRMLVVSWWMRALMNAAFSGPWASAAWGSYWTKLYVTAKPVDFSAYKAALLANLREPGRMAATKAMLNASKADVASRLEKVRAPTLVVMGTKDPDFPDPALEAATVAKLLRGSVAMIDGAGHYPQAEMPELTTPTIINFLAGARRGA